PCAPGASPPTTFPNPLNRRAIAAKLTKSQATVRLLSGSDYAGFLKAQGYEGQRPDPGRDSCGSRAGRARGPTRTGHRRGAVHPESPEAQAVESLSFGTSPGSRRSCPRAVAAYG